MELFFDDVGFDFFLNLLYVVIFFCYFFSLHVQEMCLLFFDAIYKNVFF